MRDEIMPTDCDRCGANVADFRPPSVYVLILIGRWVQGEPPICWLCYMAEIAQEAGMPKPTPESSARVAEALPPFNPNALAEREPKKRRPRILGRLLGTVTGSAAWIKHARAGVLRRIKDAKRQP